MEVLFPSGEASKPPHAHIKTTQGGGQKPKPAESTPSSGKSPPMSLSRHRWRSKQGEKRTIPIPYEPTEPVLTYLKDMKDALTTALAHGYVLARRDTSHMVPNPVALRRRVKPWFDSCYSYAKHHINPVCRTAAALKRWIEEWVLDVDHMGILQSLTQNASCLS